MVEDIDRQDFHDFGSKMKVLMGSHPWSIAQTGLDPDGGHNKASTCKSPDGCGEKGFSGIAGMDTLPYRKKAKGVMWENSGNTLVAKDLNEYGSISERFQHDSSKKGSYDLKRTSASPTTFNVNNPCMMPLLNISSVEEYISKTSTILTGTAKNGSAGPSVGALDIGVGASAYFFRVSLPGVKRDPGHFCCEIERDGKVQIRGVTTTGEKTFLRYGRVFEMKVQQQCPPGPFTLYFSLPGPVDPRLFFPNFRSDGILEAAVVKLNAIDAFKSASLNV